MSSSAPPEAPHPLEEEFPGSWPAEPTEQSQAELQQAEPLTEPRTTFNLRDEIKKNRGGSRRHRGRGRYQPRNPNYRLSRDELRELAESTLEKIDEGQYNPPHSEEPYDLATKVNFTNDNTAYYAPDDADIENWVNADLGVPTESTSENSTKIVIREYSTLVGTRRLHNLVHSRTDFQNKVVGVLNFASAKKPGGGFLNGSQAQEESIARSSTLYPSLISPVAMQFYEHYSNDPENPFYTHAMLYSPSVVIFRNDKGDWIRPIEVDILTSAAVNAGEAREQVHKEEEMRLLRERVKAAEEQRRRARERRRQREEDLKRDEEDRRRSVATKRSSDENLENRSKESVEEMLEHSEGSPKAETQQGEPEAKMEVEPDNSKESDTTPNAELSAPVADDVAQKAVVAEVVTASEPEFLLKTQKEPQDARPNSPAPISEKQPQSAPETFETTQDPYYLVEVQIDVQMYERIARILYLFHRRGAKHLILGSFGTGVFQNRVELVAGIFYDLLAKPDAKFKNVFDTVVFAILGGPTIKVFRDIFGDTVVDKIDGEDDIEEEGSEVEGMKDVESSADLQVAGAGSAALEHQMDGKAAEDFQGTQPNTSQGPAPATQDIEMSDLTQKPLAFPGPDLSNIEATTQPPTVIDEHPQPDAESQDGQIHNDAQARPDIES